MIKSILALSLMILSITFLKASVPKALESLHLIQGCGIHKITGELVSKYPGDFCVFLNDGSFLSATHTSLKYFAHDNQIQWEVPGHFHHQLNLSHDGKRILALTSEKIVEGGKNLRVDKLLVLDFRGKVLFETRSDKMLREFYKKLPNWPQPESINTDTKTVGEISHFNSFYEIPPNGSEGHFRTGNFIANGHSHGYFVLSPDLKKVFFHTQLITSLGHYTHDVQVNSRGNIIFFNNEAVPSSDVSLHSAIQEIDPRDGKVVFEFKANPVAMFYSKACGAVQELDDEYLLFSDHLNGTYIYSKFKKDIVLSVRGTHYIEEVHNPNQQVKAKNLSSFLKRRK